MIWLLELEGSSFSDPAEAEAEEDDLESPDPEPEPVLLGADDDDMLVKVSLGALTLVTGGQSIFDLEQESFIF